MLARKLASVALALALLLSSGLAAARPKIERYELEYRDDIDFARYENITEAAAYTAEYIELDEQRILNTLFDGSKTKFESADAHGRWYIDGDVRENSRAVCISDGGASAGMNSGILGSVTYVDFNMGKACAAAYGVLGGTIEYREKEYLDRFDEDDLPFMSRAEFANMIYGTLDSMGIEAEFEIKNLYSLDKGDIAECLNYLEEGVAIENKDSLFAYPKDELIAAAKDCYRFNIRQTLDGIPIIEQNQMLYPPNWSTVIGTEIDGAYCEDGIMELRIKNIMDAQMSGDKRPIIPIADIKAKLDAHYSQGILMKPTAITDMELLYLYKEAENEIRLEPVWLIKLEIQSVLDGGTVTDKEFIIYDAWSGDQIKLH